MKKPLISLALGTSAAIIAVTAAPAQDAPMTNAAAGAAPAEGACVQDLRALGTQMREDGYWLSGWNTGYGVGPTGAPMAMEPGATTAAEGAAGTGAPGRDPAGQPVATTAINQSPWGNVGWTQSPRMQIRTLHNAAVVLANRGDEQGCTAVLAAARDLYGTYVADLRDLGVSPDEVTGWRQEQIVSAVPVSQIENRINADDLVGADVRNAEDENLGEVEDVVFDPRSGQIGYLIVARGGFLGLGEDRVAVPWNQLRVTPGLNTFVLPVSEQAMENAPEMDGGTTGSIATADEYWRQAVGDVGADAEGTAR